MQKCSNAEMKLCCDSVMLQAVLQECIGATKQTHQNTEQKKTKLQRRVNLERSSLVVNLNSEALQGLGIQFTTETDFKCIDL